MWAGKGALKIPGYLVTLFSLMPKKGLQTYNIAIDFLCTFKC